MNVIVSVHNSVSNRAAVICVLLVLVLAADDLTHSQTNEESFSNRADSDAHDQSNTAGDTQPAIRYSLHIISIGRHK